MKAPADSTPNRNEAPSPLRSMLFVPGDSERKLAKAQAVPADALILDLEDAVAEARKVEARRLTAEFIAAEAPRIGPKLFVRINPLETGLAMADLAAVVVPGLAGIVLPKTHSAADVVRLGHGRDALEARAGLAPRSVAIVPVATETAEAMLTMQSYAQQPLPRLAGITWGAEDLSAAIGARSARDENGVSHIQSTKNHPQQRRVGQMEKKRDRVVAKGMITPKN